MRRVIKACALLFTSWLLTLDSLKAEVLDVTCYSGQGQNYRGAVTKTNSGRTCQSWSVQTPHSHRHTPENYPHAGLENNNYCRNPDDDRKPWCYTTDPQKYYEYCEIPRCVPDGPKNVLLAVDPPGDVVKGSSVTLTCSSSGSHPPIQSYILFKDNTVVAQKNTMSISNVQPSHSGTYRCEAQNNIATVQSPPLTVDVQYEPVNVSVEVSPSDSLAEGSSVTLSCSSDANPPVHTYTWYRMTAGPAGSSSLDHVGSEQVLLLTSLQSSHTGHYFCETRNSLGENNSADVLLEIMVVDVTCYTGRGQNYRGTVTKTTSGRTCQSWSVQTPHSHRHTTENHPCSGLENNNYCRNPDGDLKPWCVTTDPQQLYEFCEIPRCVGLPQPEPIVPELSCFTLCGQNYRGMVSTTASGRTCQSWSVQTPHSHRRTPENHPHAGLENNNYCRNPDDDRKPWCYTTDPQQQAEFCEIPRCVPDGPNNVMLSVNPPGDVVKGSSVTLTCSSSGSHPPIQSYILFKDNTVVAQKNTMSISNVQPSHSGTYHCEAFNDIAGVYSPPLTVDVHYPPEKPSVSVSPPGGVVEGSTVTLSCSSEANPPVDTYTWYKDSRSISTGPQLVKNNVSPADSGQYFCLVKNTHGSQRSSAHSLDVRPPMLPTHCEPPEVYRSNSIMITRWKSRYAPRERVFYDCMVGYTMNGGRPDVRCVAGKWTPLTLTCEGHCGRRTDQTGYELRISEGTLSRPGDHPWQVSLQHRTKGTSNPFRHACGGVLIASCWVLTAAHCINSSKDMQVVVGGVDIGSKEESDQVISVERDFVFLGYWKKSDNTATNDIALLQLKVTDDPFCAKETSYVKYACLPNKLFPDGKECVVAGWGETKDADRPHKMSHGDVSLMSEERCNEFHGSKLDDTMICARDKMGRVGSCSGDSGGPLICKDDGVYYMAGLVSWGSATCGAAIPGVYANVHRYVEWISGCIAHSGSPCRTQSVLVKDDYDY